jgi:hypothetical protein
VTVMSLPTGSALGGDYEALAARVAIASNKHTSMQAPDDPGLGQMLQRMDIAALSEPLVALRGFDGPQVRSHADESRSARLAQGTQTLATLRESDAMLGVITIVLEESVSGPVTMNVVQTIPWDPTEQIGAEPSGSDDAVAVVRDLVSRLGVPQKAVFAATGIRKSTYNTWTKPHAPRPRVDSQGRLWELAQVTAELEALLDGPVRPWLLADPDRLLHLRAGDFDSLVHDATAENPPARSASVAHAAAFAVGAEHQPGPDSGADDDDDDDDDAMVRVRVRKSTPATAGRRRPRN